MRPRQSMLKEAADQARESSDSFLDSLTLRYSTKTILLGAIIFLVSFLAYALLAPDALPNGDSVLQAQQIISRDFTKTTIHLGYYLLGAAYLLPLPSYSDFILNLMNCIFGALSVALIYFLTFTVSGKRKPALIASIFLATNYLFALNSIYAEVYVPQLFFLLLAIQLLFGDRPALSGLSFAASFLISPPTLFALPVLVILRPRKRAMIRWGLMAFVVPTLVLLPHLEDYLFGGRGLLLAAARSLDVGEAFLKEGREIFYGLYVYMPFVLAGAVLIAVKKKWRAWGAAIFTLWLIGFALGETTGNVPIQLPTYALLCSVAGLGFGHFQTLKPAADNRGYIWFASGASLLFALMLYAAIRGTPVQIPGGVITIFVIAVALYSIVAQWLGKAAGFRQRNRPLLVFGTLVFLIGLHSFLTYTIVKEVRDHSIEFRDTALEMQEMAAADYLVVGGFTDGLLFEHYALESSYTDRWINSEWLAGEGNWDEDIQARSRRQWQEAMTTSREIWLLSEFSSLFSELRQAGYTIEPYRIVYRATRK